MCLFSKRTTSKWAGFVGTHSESRMWFYPVCGQNKRQQSKETLADYYCRNKLLQNARRNCKLVTLVFNVSTFVLLIRYLIYFVNFSNHMDTMYKTKYNSVLKTSNSFVWGRQILGTYIDCKKVRHTYHKKEIISK